MHFEIVGEISGMETTVRWASGLLRQAEVHWYEAHGVGRKGWKIKRFLD